MKFLSLKGIPTKFDAKRKIVSFTPISLSNQTIKLIVKNNAQLFGTLYGIYENFLLNQYNLLNVKDKVVVDIGASIGDTAIYFALKGAKHVYAFEPYPFAYEAAVKNIKMNNLEGKVTLLNKGCGRKKTIIKIDSEYQSGGTAQLRQFKTGKQIQIVTLKDISDAFRIRGGALKLDCEGCEYGVILKSNNSTLRNFEQISIEYHYGYRNLKTKLKRAGFTFQHTLPKCAYGSGDEKEQMYFGLIFAKRK